MDIESFPYVSRAFPQLSKHGAYQPEQVYSPETVAKVVRYAQRRGIRVLPEFDTPGHVWAGWAAMTPPVLTTCYDKHDPTKVVGTGPLDPTRNRTFEVMRTLMAEVALAFNTSQVMVGGDEVNFECWASSPKVRQWIERKWPGKYNTSAATGGAYKALESFYAQRLLGMLEKQGTSYMCWEELFDNGLTLKKDTIVNVWKAGWQWCVKPQIGDEIDWSNRSCTPTTPKAAVIDAVLSPNMVKVCGKAY